jgi:Heterokaryon incompatibility protein (HET)
MSASHISTATLTLNRSSWSTAVSTVSDQNLWNHLDVAREKYFGQTFWIDAVGINQADDDEKGHQVGLTGRIYTRA